MLLAEYDYATDIAVQREESEAIGLEKGRKDGLTQRTRQTKLETACLMVIENLDINLISKVTGPSEAEIERL